MEPISDESPLQLVSRSRSRSPKPSPPSSRRPNQSPHELPSRSPSSCRSPSSSSRRPCQPSYRSLSQSSYPSLSQCVRARARAGCGCCARACSCTRARARARHRTRGRVRRHRRAGANTPGGGRAAARSLHTSPSSASLPNPSLCPTSLSSPDRPLIDSPLPLPRSPSRSPISALFPTTSSTRASRRFQDPSAGTQGCYTEARAVLRGPAQARVRRTARFLLRPELPAGHEFSRSPRGRRPRRGAQE